MLITCPQCGKEADKQAGAVNRAHGAGLKIYCSRECSHLGRRDPGTKDRIKARIREYWQRPENKERKKRRNAEVYQQQKAELYAAHKARMETDPGYRAKYKAAQQRCQDRPEWKAHKRGYDRRYRATREYGEMAEAYLVLLELNEEVERQEPDRVELYRAKGTLNKSQGRKRDYECSETDR